LLEDRLVAEASRRPEDQDTILKLRSTKQRAMQLFLEVPRDASPQHRADRLRERDRLVADIGRLEEALARRVAGLGQARRALGVTIDSIQAALPAGTVLVEFVRYQHYLGKSKFEPRYGAVVLGQSGDPTWFSLGSAEETETKIRHLQKAVRMRVSDVKIAAVLRALHRQVWTPIAAALPSG